MALMLLNIYRISIHARIATIALEPNFQIFILFASKVWCKKNYPNVTRLENWIKNLFFRPRTSGLDPLMVFNKLLLYRDLPIF